MNARKRTGDADLDSLLRAARPTEPAPLDPERARAIFERAVALSNAEAEASREAAPAADAAPSWWERLCSLLAIPAAPAGRLAWGTAAGVAFAAVLLVSVAVTGGSHQPGGGGGRLATNGAVGGNGPVPVVKAPAVTPDTPGAAASVAAAAREAIAGGSIAAAKPAPSPTGRSDGPAVRRERIGRLASNARNPRRIDRSRKSVRERAAPRSATPAGLAAEEDLPLLMVASNLPQGDDAERLVISVREDAPADLPGYAEAASLREMPVGPAGPAGLPGEEGPAAPSTGAGSEGRVELVWVESQVRSGGEPSVVITPVEMPSGGPDLEDPEPLPEPVPVPEPESNPED